MKLEPIKFEYERSQTEHFQGNKSELGKQKRKGYREIAGGCGSYVMSRPSKASVLAVVDGKVEEFSVKSAIREAYDREKVTEAALRTLEKDVKEGRKEIHYENGKGIIIK